mmetsp:Transcript_91901/g.213614  ORF Transcript_91901/g.213614 Transcript_91901/m.213614 type:complete len:281 (+) Transcript_91901:182-1024(+)
MFDIDLDDLDAEDAVKAGEQLHDAAFNVRRDACKKLGELGDTSKAEPHLLKLKELAGNDPDYEVKRAARKALQELREKGLYIPAAKIGPNLEEAVAIPGAARNVTDLVLSYSGPKILLGIFKEVFPMRIEQDAVTPTELTELWENHWGVQYAGRVRFEAAEGSPTKWLNPREDIVPRSPHVVQLHASAGSILLDLSTALRQYGMLTREQVEVERERKRQQQVIESEKSHEANARQQERWREASLRKQQRGTEETFARLPFVRNKALGEQAIAGLGSSSTA